MEQAVLHALYYFELFSWPLTGAEVLSFTQRQTNLAEVAEKLSALVERGLVFRFEAYYQTQDEPFWCKRRQEYESRADRFLPLARRMADFIGSFPFVRAVFVSGSLSKHSMPPDGDIDFFIATVPGRLWLARTLLVFFKKVFLFNSHKYFCINYFVDTEHLGIEEKNIFTATEIVTMVPLYGRDWCEAFGTSNAWAWAWLPNFLPRSLSDVRPQQRGWLKKTAEWLLAGRLGAWADRQAMRLTVGFWRRKFKHLGQEAFDTSLKSRPYMSKHHPQHFQAKVLEAYQKRVDGLT